MVLDEGHLMGEQSPPFHAIALCGEEGADTLPGHALLCARCGGATGLLREGSPVWAELGPPR